MVDVGGEINLDKLESGHLEIRWIPKVFSSRNKKPSMHVEVRGLL